MVFQHSSIFVGQGWFSRIFFAFHFLPVWVFLMVLSLKIVLQFSFDIALRPHDWAILVLKWLVFLTLCVAVFVINFATVRLIFDSLPTFGIVSYDWLQWYGPQSEENAGDTDANDVTEEESEPLRSSDDYIVYAKLRKNARRVLHYWQILYPRRLVDVKWSSYVFKAIWVGAALAGIFLLGSLWVSLDCEQCDIVYYDSGNSFVSVRKWHHAQPEDTAPVDLDDVFSQPARLAALLPTSLVAKGGAVQTMLSDWPLPSMSAAPSNVTSDASLTNTTKPICATGSPQYFICDVIFKGALVMLLLLGQGVVMIWSIADRPHKGVYRSLLEKTVEVSHLNSGSNMSEVDALALTASVTDIPLTPGLPPPPDTPLALFSPQEPVNGSSAGGSDTSGWRRIPLPRQLVSFISLNLDNIRAYVSSDKPSDTDEEGKSDAQSSADPEHGIVLEDIGDVLWNDENFDAVTADGSYFAFLSACVLLTVCLAWSRSGISFAVGTFLSVCSGFTLLYGVFWIAVHFLIELVNATDYIHTFVKQLRSVILYDIVDSFLRVRFMDEVDWYVKRVGWAVNIGMVFGAMIVITAYSYLCVLIYHAYDQSLTIVILYNLSTLLLIPAGTFILYRFRVKEWIFGAQTDTPQVAADSDAIPARAPTLSRALSEGVTRARGASVDTVGEPVSRADVCDCGYCGAELFAESEESEDAHAHTHTHSHSHTHTHTDTQTHTAAHTHVHTHTRTRTPEERTPELPSPTPPSSRVGGTHVLDDKFLISPIPVSENVLEELCVTCDGECEHKMSSSNVQLTPSLRGHGNVDTLEHPLISLSTSMGAQAKSNDSHNNEDKSAHGEKDSEIKDNSDNADGSNNENEAKDSVFDSNDVQSDVQSVLEVSQQRSPANPSLPVFSGVPPPVKITNMSVTNAPSTAAAEQSQESGQKADAFQFLFKYLPSQPRYYVYAVISLILSVLLIVMIVASWQRSLIVNQTKSPTATDVSDASSLGSILSTVSEVVLPYNYYVLSQTHSYNEAVTPPSFSKASLDGNKESDGGDVKVLSSVLQVGSHVLAVGHIIGAEPNAAGMSSSTGPSDSGFTQSEDVLCRARVEGLSLVQCALFAQMPYFQPFSEDFEEYRQSFFPEWEIKFSSVTKHGREVHQSQDDTRPSRLIFYDFYHPAQNMSVVVIRGTNAFDFFDYLVDLDVWLEAAVFQVFANVLPGLALWPIPLRAQAIDLIHRTVTWLLPGLTQSPELQYMTPLVEYVGSIKQERARVLVIGHSLGGGAAKIAASLNQVPGVSISGPGLLESHLKLGISRPDIDHYIVNVVPSFDVVAQIGNMGGAMYSTPCSLERADTCHSPFTSICYFINKCGSSILQFPQVTPPYSDAEARSFARYSHRIKCLFHHFATMDALGGLWYRVRGSLQ